MQKKPLQFQPKPYDAATLADARANDIARAKLRGDGSNRLGKTSGRLRMQVDLRAVMNAVDGEGPEVLTKAADGYWADMRRRHPHIACGRPDPGQSINGMRNRHGRVSTKIMFKNGRKIVIEG